MNKKSTWIGRILIAVDQFANALAGGNEDATISGRLGYLYMNRQMKWTTFLMVVVDTTFKSIDGHSHCLQSYMLAGKENMTKFRRGNDVALAILGLITIAACIILIVPVWIYSLFVKDKWKKWTHIDAITPFTLIEIRTQRGLTTIAYVHKDSTGVGWKNVRTAINGTSINDVTEWRYK